MTAIVPPPPRIDSTSDGTAHPHRPAVEHCHQIGGMTPTALDAGQPPDYGLAIEMLIRNDNLRKVRAGPLQVRSAWGQASNDPGGSKLLQPMLVYAHTGKDLGRVLTEARRSFAAPVLVEANSRSDLQAGWLLHKEAARPYLRVFSHFLQLEHGLAADVEAAKCLTPLIAAP